MAERHPAVEFLLAAHRRAEGLANAATPGPWKAEASRDHGFRVGTADGSAWVAWTGAFDDEPESSGPDAEFVAANDPVTVLRRIVAEREQLAEHELERAQYPGRADRTDDVCYCCSKPLPAEPYETAWCGACHNEDDARFEGFWHGFPGGPCRTVLLLARAWGWEKDSDD